MTMLKKISVVLFFSIIFAVFFNGYKSEGPSRKKFKNLGEGEIDLTKEEEAPEINRLKDISRDRRFKPWEAWWQKCIGEFALDSMDDIGTLATFDEQIPFQTPDILNDGPSKMFYQRSPGGKYVLNPYWSRLRFKKEGDGWQPYIELRCGTAVYDIKEKKARNVLDCSALEGVDDAFWLGKDRFVLMGYESITRQMNVECEGTQTCVAPVVWIVDLKSGSINEHRGKVAKRSSCDLGGYLRVRLPKFFEAEKDKGTSKN